MKLIIILLTCLSINTARALEIWTSNENVAAAIKTRAKIFEKEFGHIVNVTILNKDLTNQFKTAALTGKGPDIFCWAHDVVGELAKSGLIEPINMTKKFKSQFIKVAIDSFTYKSRIYGYPYDVESVALIYNKDLLKKLPDNIEEFYQIDKELKKTDSNIYAFLFDFKNFFFSFPFIASQGGYIFKNNQGTLSTSDIGLNNSGSVIGVKFLRNLVIKEIIPTSVDRSISFNKMKSNLLMATIDGPWAIEDLKKSGINFGVAPIPKLNGKTVRPFVGSHGFIIRRSSKKKELAKEFIEKYLVTKAGIIDMYKFDPRGPSRIDALKELSQNDPTLEAFMKSASVGVPMPNVPEMGAVWSAVGNALSSILKGNIEAKKALNLAVEQIKSTLQ